MSIYKANDIRGIYGTDLNDRDAYALGNAFVRFTKSKRIVVGRDNRLSSPALHTALIKGITEAGTDVLDVGLIDSPGLYFATWRYKHPGVMITASHNPAAHNGFYLCKKDGECIYQDKGLRTVEALAQQPPLLARTKGTVRPITIAKDYTAHILSFITRPLRPLKVVVDAGNGMGAPIAQSIFSHIPQMTIVPLYFASNGSFPYRGPDTTVEKNLLPLRKRVLKEKADVGIAFDGDADRIAFVDERGTIIEGSLIGALLADALLKKTRKRETLVYTIGCSRIVPETIRAYGGLPVRERVGHSFVNARMRATHALFGTEHTGHYFYRDNFYTESPLITVLKVCELLSNTSPHLSGLIAPYKKYYMTKEISFHTKDQSRVMETIKKHLLKTYHRKIETFDGLFVDVGTYWFRIRASQTESLIRLVIEGTDKELVEKKRAIFAKMIENVLQPSRK